MSKEQIAVAYARFSTEMQREESIDAQIRAIREYAKRNNMTIIDEYIDRAKSATSDKRPDFQRMIRDATGGKFGAIIVHKLDRFARDRYDSAHYKFQLKRSGVTLYSVTENLDGSPESIVLESVLEGMAEYYSKNLAREVEKGKRENAIKGRHVGGIPPLGYDVDKNTMQLVLNKNEAEAVRTIFRLYLRGAGYSEIIKALSVGGYKTKRGRDFGKGSLYEILRNEKYTGTYVYGKSAPKDFDGKYNRHKYKDDNEIIRVENAIPQIVTFEDFAKVQDRMNHRKHTGGRHSAIETYLLSGKILCGECGSKYTGFTQKARSDHPKRVIYRCGKKHGAARCTNSSVNRDGLEQFILKSLADKVFNPESLPRILSAYNSYALSRNESATSKKRRLETQLADIDTQISNIVEVVAKTASTALLDKLCALERDKEQINSQMDILARELSSLQMDGKTLKSLFLKAKRKFTTGGLTNNRELIDKYVDKVVIYPEHVEVYFNIGDRERQGSYENSDALNHLSNLLAIKADRDEVLGVAKETESTDD